LGPYGVSLRSPAAVVLEAATSFHVPTSLSAVFTNRLAPQAKIQASLRL
jgi:hypothetical protein